MVTFGSNSTKIL